MRQNILHSEPQIFHMLARKLYDACMSAPLRYSLQSVN